MEQPKIWDYSLGVTAEVNTISNDVIDERPGSPTFKNLYPEITGIPIANGGIAVKRKDINALFKLIGEQIFFIQRGGIYKWDYNATYPKGAIISHNDVLYRAKAENTSRDPSIDTDSWAPLIEVTQEDLQNIEVSDGSLLEKGIVQLTNTISDNETMAVTPKAVKSVLDQLNDLSSQVSSLESNSTTLAGSIAQNTNDISLLQNKDSQFETDISNLRSLIGDGTEIDLSSIQSQIDAIVAINTQQSADIEALQNSQGGDFAEAITALQASDTNQDGQISELNNKVSAAETDINTLNNSTTNLSSSINTHTTDISDLQSRVSNLESQSPDGLQDQIDSASLRIESLETEYNNLVGIYNYSAEKTYNPNDIVLYNGILYKAIVESVGNIPTNVSYFEVFDTNQELSSKVSTIEGNVSTNTTNISNLSTRVENAEIRISALENADESDADLSQIEANISALDTRVTALENNPGTGDTSSLEARLDTAESNISSLQSSDISLSDRITALENGGSSSDLTDLTQRITTAESDISNINTTLNSKADSLDLTTTNSNVTALDTRVTALENSPSGGGVSYQFFSLDASGDIDDDAGLDESEPYVTYQADSRSAVTAISVSGTTTTINIDHTKDIRRMRIMIPSEALGNPTANYDNPIRIILKYDDADAVDNAYDVWKTNYIYPTAQVWLDGNLAKGSVQGNSSYMEVTKLWWNVDTTGCPMLYVSFANTLAQPVCVILNF